IITNFYNDGIFVYLEWFPILDAWGYEVLASDDPNADISTWGIVDGTPDPFLNSVMMPVWEPYTKQFYKVRAIYE
ncbi:MAG: hypothetical protein GQ534_04520, partial [Candidatus Delongbacteria bacterium]|nr:hypothetical protein [Candidatus Delongbacteria bacterium]